MGLLSEEVPSYESIVHEEELPPLHLKLIIDCVSSIPLYDRLDIDKRSLSENEIKVMELLAEEYNDKICNLISDKKLETRKDDFNVLESEYSQIEEFSDLFLKNLYNCSDNDELLIRIKGNMPFDEGIQESTSEVKLVHEIEPYAPSKEFLHFFLNASDGKYDNLVVQQVLPLHDSSSDVSSDENDEIREDKIKKLSYKLRFCESTNSKFLEPILNASKPCVFEIILESSSKLPTLKKEEIFLSDSESENDLKKNFIFEVDKTSNKQLPHQIKKDLKVLKNKRENLDSKGGKTNLKKTCESKSGEKITIENIQRSRNYSNTPSFDQAKINLDNITTSGTSTNVLVSPRHLTKIDENVKGINEKQIKHETSSSGDEDWECLAEKNLFLRSKTLGQKVSKKK